eukprot:TRINITY_DN366_c0_g1_i1.p1 TRINITY_DN366_c0_g1~~TRINITY_DN366_c0_g1_i1.p1  ORF type:complete len:214 (-),score=46.28 TRINITY_DN366_c0_g1_i1:54-695(-)
MSSFVSSSSPVVTTGTPQRSWAAIVKGRQAETDGVKPGPRLCANASEFVPATRAVAQDFKPCIFSADSPEFVPPAFWASITEFVPLAFSAGSGSSLEFVPASKSLDPTTPWTCTTLQAMLDNYDDLDSDSDIDSEEESPSMLKGSRRAFSSGGSTSAGGSSPSDTEEEDESEAARHIRVHWEAMEAPPGLEFMKPPPGLEHLGHLPAVAASAC